VTPKIKRQPCPFFRAVLKTRRPPYQFIRAVPKTRRPPNPAFRAVFRKRRPACPAWRADASRKPGGRPTGHVGGPAVASLGAMALDTDKECLRYRALRREIPLLLNKRSHAVYGKK